MKLVVDKNIPFIKGLLEAFADIRYMQGSCIGKDDIRDADGLIIRTRTRLGPDVLEGSSVKFIGTTSALYAIIDIKDDLLVRTVPGSDAWAMSEEIFPLSPVVWGAIWGVLKS